MRRLAVFLLAAIGATSSASAPAAAETKLKMLYTAVTGFGSAYLAQEAGFFKKRGIDVEFILTQSSGNNPPALVSGSVQIRSGMLNTSAIAYPYTRTSKAVNRLSKSLQYTLYKELLAQASRTRILPVKNSPRVRACW